MASQSIVTKIMGGDEKPSMAPLPMRQPNLVPSVSLMFFQISPQNIREKLLSITP